MIALCRYILQGGRECQQAALKDGPYCRHHQIVRKAVAGTGPESNDPYLMRRRLPFVFPEDRASVQINYFILLQALNDRRIDAKTAGIMMRVLKATDANLKKGPLDESGKPEEPVSEDTGREVSHPENNLVNELADDAAEELASQPMTDGTEPHISEQADEPDSGISAQNAGPSNPPELDEATLAAIQEIDRLYRDDPDYADRIRDAVWRKRPSQPASAANR